jgi:DNA-binding CsgD family transcriptional regulator
MTRLIFFPGEGSFVVLDSPLSAEELTRAVNKGEWTLPAPYGFLNPENNGEVFLKASCQNDVVVVTFNKPFLLTPKDGLAMLEPIIISARQQEVLMAMAEGLSTKQIAIRLMISKRMVHYHIAKLKESYGSLTRAQSVGKAATLGLYRQRVRSRKNVK